MKTYRAGRRGSKFSAWSDYKTARAVFRDKLVGKGPYKWKMKDAKAWSGECDLPKVMRNLDRLQPGMTETDAFWAKVLSTGSIFVLDVGEEHILIPPAPSGISDSMVKAHKLTFGKTEELDLKDSDDLHVVTMGYTVCKWISGTRTPSQHCPGPPSPTGGNAMDWVVKRRDGSVDIGATDKVVAHLEANGFPEVLWRGVPNHYPNHAHTSGNPKRSGTPGCL
jgi:hypothetical protein